jgi:cytoskeletal protein RodZ
MLAAVALVVLIAVLVGVLWVRSAAAPTATDSRPVAPPPTASATVASSQPVTSPSTSTAVTPTAARTSSQATSKAPAPAPEPTQQFVGAGETATFRYFAVTVLEDAPAAPVDTKAGLKVRVCVRELPPGTVGTAVRISRDPWRLVSDKNISLTPATTDLYTPAFPVETTKAVGQCQEGFLTFKIPPSFFNDSSNLVYTNGLGESASWNFH